MNIRLITGASTYEACINTIKQIDGTNAEEYNLLVVPDAFSMQAENLLFDVLNLRSVFNIEVVGISRLAGHILRENNVAFSRVSGLEEVFTIFKAVKACEEKFEYFGKCDVDFCTKLLQIIKQLKGCKISPEKIKETGEATLDRKMHDIKLVYQKYDELLGDRLDLSKMLEFCVQNAGRGFDLSKTNLFFANFDSFSLEINSFICELSKKVNSVCIGMSRALSTNNAFIFENDIFEKTTALAKENSILVKTENFASNLAPRQKLMAENLFGFNVKPGKKDDYFLNVLAKNKQDEVEFVAKYIKNGLVSGAKLNDFSIAVSGEEYYEKLSTVFEKYGISYYSDEATRLSDTVLSRFLLKILEFALLGLGKEKFQYLAASPLLNVNEKDTILHEIQFFNIEKTDEFLERFPQFEKVLGQIKLLSKANKVKEFVAVLREVISSCEENYAEIISMLSEKRFFKEESQNSQTLSLLNQVLDKLVSLGGEEEMNLTDFQNLFTLSLESVKVETIPSFIDAVYVGDATKSYFEDEKVLIVLGATAGALPSVRADNGIIDDSDIEKLRLNFMLEPEIKVLNRRSRLKLFECLLHAKEKLIVCMPAVENGQKSQTPGFVKDLRTLFGENIIHTSALEVIGDSGENALGDLKFLVGTKENLPNVYALLKNKQDLPVLFEGVLKANMETEIFKDKPLEFLSEKTKGVHFANGRVSATQLETYFKCPFRHFMSYGLKIKENETIEPNPRLLGNFVHAMLEKFVGGEKSLEKMDEKDVKDFLNKNVIEIAKTVYDEKILKRKSFLTYLKNVAKIILNNVVYEQKMSDFRPAYLEERICQDFGEEKLTGYVDRVDVFGDYFRILDYKTGKTGPIEKELFYGKKLQLILYARAMSEKLSKTCGGVYYFACDTKYSKKDKSSKFNGLTLENDKVVLATDKRLVDEDFKSDINGMSFKKGEKKENFSFKGGKSVESFDGLFDYAEKVSKKAVEEIKSGFVLDKPFKGECQFCPYLAVCGHKKEDGFREEKSLKKAKEEEE